ncbi:thiamine-phosphate kinase [Gayadomonas joobiniege]|uniref:thiamine-phosphate kinase n=1 Tax=Gayadomonas joobiniege TaxID=1234606 RepID=UPI00036FB66F|nr:thiamine-phosphate kinase [Gayadomonas joobiniege]
MAEFDIISRYFSLPGQPASVVLDKGDDCALIKVAQDSKELIAITTDTLNSGTHFLPDIDPHALAYRALATNLSDLAAMGAKPEWFNLAVSLPKELANNEAWLAGFSQGLRDLSNESGIYLIGGDTTSGPLSITITAMGKVTEQRAMLRSQAKENDLICVTGTVGDAAGALKILLKQIKLADAAAEQALLKRFHYPQARYHFAQGLAKYSSCAIDISDGLLADLKHILAASRYGAQINIEKLPLSPWLTESFSQKKAVELALGGGDDYELCFTIAESAWDKVQELAEQCQVPVTAIGRITSEKALKLMHQGAPYETQSYGYQHFI